MMMILIRPNVILAVQDQHKCVPLITVALRGGGAGGADRPGRQIFGGGISEFFHSKGMGGQARQGRQNFGEDLFFLGLPLLLGEVAT
jgi:hypothetical protein